MKLVILCGKYVDQKGSVAMLVAKRLVGVAPGVNLMINSGFETQRKRYENLKTRVPVVSQKGK